MSELNKNEMEAMRILWARGASKPAEIQSEFAWPIENATLRSVLTALVQRKLAKRGLRGKAYYYQALGSQRGMLSKMARRMAQVFTGGSTAGLIAQLMQQEKFSKEEIEELRRIAAEKISEGK